MSIAKDILIDEYKRLKNLLKEYQKKLNELPKGSISEKKIKNHYYYYLAYRKMEKVKFEYIGKKDSVKYSKIKSQLLKRNKLLEKIKEVKQYIKELSKYVK